jgi:hypothetical protein
MMTSAARADEHPAAQELPSGALFKEVCSAMPAEKRKRLEKELRDDGRADTPFMQRIFTECTLLFDHVCLRDVLHLQRFRRARLPFGMSAVCSTVASVQWDLCDI